MRLLEKICILQTGSNDVVSKVRIYRTIIDIYKCMCSVNMKDNYKVNAENAYVKALELTQTLHPCNEERMLTGNSIA